MAISEFSNAAAADMLKLLVGSQPRRRSADTYRERQRSASRVRQLRQVFSAAARRSGVLNRAPGALVDVLIAELRRHRQAQGRGSLKLSKVLASFAAACADLSRTIMCHAPPRGFEVFSPEGVSFGR
jgi:hypothetical protein